MLAHPADAVRRGLRRQRSDAEAAAPHPRARRHDAGRRRPRCRRRRRSRPTTICAGSHRSSSSTAPTRCAASTRRGSVVGIVTRDAVAARLADGGRCHDDAQSSRSRSKLPYRRAGRHCARDRVGALRERARGGNPALPEGHRLSHQAASRAGRRVRVARRSSSGVGIGIWLSRPWMARWAEGAIQAVNMVTSIPTLGKLALMM